MSKNMKEKIKFIAIVAGGALEQSLLPQIRKADYVVGVDRGAYWLIANHIMPDVAIGDFDSVRKGELATVEKYAKLLMKHSTQKDETDLELAVDYLVTLKPKNVEIYGALGTRFDHVWAGVHLLSRLESHNIMGQIVDNFNRIHIVRRLEIVKPLAGYPYISIFPLGAEALVTLKGFLYSVTQKEFSRGSTLGVSNEIASKSAQIIVHRGAVLVVRSRD